LGVKELAVTEQDRFTPGPWSLSDVFVDDDHVLGADGFPVAEVGETAILPGYTTRYKGHWAGHPGKAYIDRDREEVDANRRLICAAPELLAELRKFVAAETSDDEATANARAIIARIAGGTR
jgi:hypothetical protein